MQHKWLKYAFLVMVMSLGVTWIAFAQGPAPASGAAYFAQRSFDLSRLERVTLQDGQTFERAFSGSKLEATGTAEFFVQLADPAVADIWLAAQKGNNPLTAAAAQAYAQRLVDRQAFLANRVEALGGNVLADYQRLFNGLAVEIDVTQLEALARLEGVVRITPVRNYELLLDETVPWIGASFVQQYVGRTGAGIRVAVLDSGIDYTHAHLGGSGLQVDTDKAIVEASQPADPALYPTAKVIGGYDFVGSVWPEGPLAPDPNPMDDQAGGTEGHGTHVASIIAGVDTRAAGGIGPGVAPGAELYALKVCSSVSGSCSGVALLQSYEWASDPDGDFDFSDRADVINLSLGSIYGQPGDVDNIVINTLSELGAVVVSSAGNGGDNPYVQGMPSGVASAISVAESTVPSAFRADLQITAPTGAAGVHEMAHFPWSGPYDSLIAGEAVHTLNTGCTPADFPAGVAGKIVVVDRGGCFFSDKVYYGQQAGATAVIVGLITPEAPFAGAQGSFFGQVTAPGFMTTLAANQAIKNAQNAGATVQVVLDPTFGAPLPDVIVSSSSRGPAFGFNTIKPEIAAPGASVSASSGDQGYSVFGGTSGAAPMVAGAAALLLESEGGSASLTPAAVKARLMNNAQTLTWQNVPGGMPSPISRQGAGRLNVAAAVLADAMAWIPDDGQAGLSFGYAPVTGPYSDAKTVEVLNLSNSPKRYDVLVTYRYAGDIATGVDVSPSTNTLMVPAGGSATFDVLLNAATNVDLFDYPVGGQTFNDSNALTLAEIDGFVTLFENDLPARIRVVHASPDAPPVNICVNGAPAVQGLAFTEFTAYIPVPAGPLPVQVEAAGGETPCAGPFVYEETLMIAARTDYTVAAVGKLADETFGPVITVDNNAPPAAKTAHVRVAHLSPDAPPVDIAVTNGPVLISGLAFPNTSAEVPVPAGFYDLEVRVAGTGTVVFALPGVALQDGVVYTAFAMGEAATESLGVFVATERATGLSLPFHFLPRKAADLSVPEDELVAPQFPETATLAVSNNSPIVGEVEVYALMDINPPLGVAPGNNTNPVDLAYVGTEVIPDVLGDGRNLYIFMIATHEPYSHPLPILHRVWVDLDQDGVDDYLVQNEDLGDGRWVSVQYDLATEEGSASSFLDSFMNSSTLGLYLLAEDADLAYSFQVFSYDAYFGENGFIKLWDVSPPGADVSGAYHRYDAENPAFVASQYFFEAAPQSVEELLVAALPPGDSSQIGLLFRYFNGADEVDAVPMTAASPPIFKTFLPIVLRQP